MLEQNYVFGALNTMRFVFSQNLTVLQQKQSKKRKKMISENVNSRCFTRSIVWIECFANCTTLRSVKTQMSKTTD